jgi:hypothetical protein
MTENSQLLNVPSKKPKKTSSMNVTDRSLSPHSPAELRMNVSGNFSDFMSSDEDVISNSGQSHKSLKNKQLSSRSNQKRSLVNNSVNNKLLPEIEENKSI